MSETLQEKVTKFNSKNKRRIGYTVGAYGSVLSALNQSNGTNQNNDQQRLISGEAPTQTVISRSYSFLASHSTDMDVVENGFIKNDELKQMQVQFDCFMGYPVEVATSDGKTTYEYVENVPIVCNKHGFSDINGRVYPSSDRNEVKNQTDTTNNYCIGLGVSLSIAVVDYFKHFYDKMKVFADSNSCQDVIKKLTSNGLLYCEVMIPISSEPDVNKKYQNKVIHLKVIADSPNTSTTSSYKVYIPIPVLLLNSYKEIGNISVNVNEQSTNNNGVYIVNGDGGVKFLYKDKDFNHKEAKIEGFTCEDVKKHYFIENDVLVKHAGWELNKKVQFGRARFYLENSNELSSILNEEIPAEYQESLFRGVLTEDKVYRTNNTIISAPTAGGGGLTEACKYMAQLIHNVLTPKQVERAEAQVASFEGGGRWDAWNPQDKNEGASIGRHQMSSRAGNVLEYLNVYKSMGGEVSSGFMNEAIAASKVKGRVDGSKMLPYKTEFERQSATVIGQNAQLRVFFNGVKGKNTAKWFNELKCTTALELSSIMGAVNHWPYGMDAAYSAYKDDIIKAESLNKKAELIERCHMAANYAAVTKGIKKSTWVQSVFESINFKTLSTSDSNLSTWKGRHEKMINFAKDGKFDM